jgi:hypothetical protein
VQMMYKPEKTPGKNDFQVCIGEGWLSAGWSCS